MGIKGSVDAPVTSSSWRQRQGSCQKSYPVAEDCTSCGGSIHCHSSEEVKEREQVRIFNETVIGGDSNDHRRSEGSEFKFVSVIQDVVRCFLSR